jgi:hypothetical protein
MPRSYAPQAGPRHCARGRFFIAARGVIHLPSFEVISDLANQAPLPSDGW